MKIIGVDFDDILLNFNGSFVEFHNSTFGTDNKREDLKSFYLEELWNISVEEIQKRLHSFYRSDYHKNAPPIEGAIEAINKLADRYDIFIITASPEDVKDKIEVWLKKHFTNQFKGVRFIRKSSFDKSIKNKRDVCKELGIELFIDDAMHNAEDIASIGIPVLLFDTPWNQGPVKSPITRVYSWAEIVEKLIN